MAINSLLTLKIKLFRMTNHFLMFSSVIFYAYFWYFDNDRSYGKL